jgi:hypothetical protein
MKTRIIGALAFAATTMLLFGGCSLLSPPANDAAGSSKSSESSFEEKSPAAPVVMSTVEAGDKFLDIICKSNATVDPFSAAWTAAANGTGDLATLAAIAATSRDADNTAALALEDPTLIWPENVAENAKGLAGELYAESAVLANIVNAPDVASATASVFPASLGNAQAMRAKLGISADPVASCVGR